MVEGSPSRPQLACLGSLKKRPPQPVGLLLPDPELPHAPTISVPFQARPCWLLLAMRSVMESTEDMAISNFAKLAPVPELETLSHVLACPRWWHTESASTWWR